jgi:anti-sigma factor RsiW
MSATHDDAAAYALVSLDAAEMAEFEAHLATCEFCQQEVAEFSNSIAELSLLTQASPPPTLRSKVLAAIQNVPQLPAEREANGKAGTPPNGHMVMETRSLPGVPRRALPGSWIPDEPEPTGVDELKLRRQRRRTRILGGLVAALLLVTVGLGGVIYNLAQQRQEQVAQQTFEQQLLRAEDARIVVTPTTVGGRCTFIVSRQLNRALYLGTNMPDPGQGKHYQLWTATGTETNLDPDLDNSVPGVRPWKQFFRGDVAQADFLAVSIEQDGTTPDVPTPDQVVVLAEIS